MPHKSDSETIQTTHNTARFFTENRHVAWTVLAAVALWGVYGYATMPKRKDPDIPVRVAVALTPWPGVAAAKVAQLVTRTVEQTIAKSQWIRQPGAYDYGIRSLTLDGLSIVWVQLDEQVTLTKQEFDNINLKLKGIADLPEGAGPIQFNGDFGDTAALMLTVASPKESDVAISLRARTIADAIKQARAQSLPSPQGGRASLVVAFPLSISSSIPQRVRDLLARLRLEERAQLSDLQNLYVYASQNSHKAPLPSISSLAHQMETPRIRRRDHFRTISVRAFPAPGALPSEVVNATEAQLTAFAKTLPPGYTMTIGGERAKQETGFKELTLVLAMSAALIFLALVSQFNNAVKPILVFAAVPYGAVGALAALYVMGTPCGFMAFLGIVSLVGVIISHVIVLFDFIEEAHERGEPLIDSLLDAGIARLRPVMITVGATVLALFPLALHGGPLWQPLCYAQIGGLSVATFIELLLVPVLYAIFVLDLKIVKWEKTGDGRPEGEAAI